MSVIITDARRRHPTARLRPGQRPPRVEAPQRPRGRERRELARAARAERRSSRRERRFGVVAEGTSSPPLFWTLLGTIVALCLLGLVFVLSASAVRADRRFDSSWYWFQRQGVFLGLGMVMLMIGLCVPYRTWIRLAGPILGVTTLMLVVVLIPSSISHEVNGSRRWIGPELAQFQPSELAKLAMILWLARLLSRRMDQIRDVGATIVPAGMVLATLALLIYLEPDLGTAVLLVAITFAMLTVAGARVDVLMLAAIPVAVIGVVLAFSDYRWARMMAFVDPWKQETTAGWQVIQSRVGIASGGVFGVGLGNGRSKWGFLPEAHTDFIYSVIGEELGLIGCLAVLAAFLLFIVAGITAGRRARDTSGMLIAIGISTWVGLQALVNIGVAIGVLPNKGLTLPFVSYGGSSLTLTLFAAGILLNVARNPAVRPPVRTRRVQR